jgi:thioredoxin reductase (NADPH)
MCQVVEAYRDASLERLVIADSATGEHATVPARALFIFIGALPRTQWLNGPVQRAAQGFILSGPDLKRGDSVAGDMRHRSIKRVASGAVLL